MKEAYVTYEIAKLLKEKGFHWPTCYYTLDQKVFCGIAHGSPIDHNMSYTSLSVPTQQMAMRWLWEEKGLNVNAIYGDYPALKKSFWMPQIDSLEDSYGTEDENFFREYDSREDCIEAALKYCLTNLI